MSAVSAPSIRESAHDDRWPSDTSAIPLRAALTATHLDADPADAHNAPMGTRRVILMLWLSAVSGCAQMHQREPASDGGAVVPDASTCVDERIGERPCSVVWAQGFGENRGSRWFIRDVAVRADDAVGAVRGADLSTLSHLLAYDALGSLVAAEPPFVVERLAEHPDGFLWASGLENGSWSVSGAHVIESSLWSLMQIPRALQLVPSARGSIVLADSWSGSLVRPFGGPVVVATPLDVGHSGLLAWDPSGNLRWSFVVTSPMRVHAERRVGADESLLVAFSLPTGAARACAFELLCLEAGTGALVLIETWGAVRWIFQLPMDAGSTVVMAVERDPSGGMYVLTESALTAFEADATTRWRIPFPVPLSAAHLMWNNGSLVLTFGVPSETITLGRTRVRDCSAAVNPQRQLVARIDTLTGDAIDAWELDEGLWVTDLDARSDGSVVVGLESHALHEAPSQTLCGATVEVDEGDAWRAAVAVLR